MKWNFGGNALKMIIRCTIVEKFKEKVVGFLYIYYVLDNFGCVLNVRFIRSS